VRSKDWTRGGGGGRGTGLDRERGRFNAIAFSRKGDTFKGMEQTKGKLLRRCLGSDHSVYRGTWEKEPHFPDQKVVRFCFEYSKGTFWHLQRSSWGRRIGIY